MQVEDKLVCKKTFPERSMMKIVQDYRVTGSDIFSKKGGLEFPVFGI
jgi:hypothetical protein